MAKANLTAQRLRELLNYDPLSGNFSRRSAPYHISRVDVLASACGSRDYSYLQLWLDGTNHRAHRLAWLHFYGQWPVGVIDHVNGNRFDNSITNLRDTTVEENMRNLKRYKNNRTGITGVSWDTEHANWRSVIYVDRKQVNLGRHPTLFDAAAARKSAEARFGFHTNHGSARTP